MARIEEIDKNFGVNDIAVKDGTTAYDVRNAPFSVHGVFFPVPNQDVFFRIPGDKAWNISHNVGWLSNYSAGGRIRFKTNSPYIAVKAKMGGICKMPHFTLTGTAGFDLYCGESHVATFQPKYDITDELFGEVDFGRAEMREYTLNMPPYSEIKELYIILNDGASLEAAEPYKYDKPVVFYGSSITEGGCASRPGCIYSAIVSRRLDAEILNLGFSGSAKGEDSMAEYIASLDMTAFVYDYDHNADTIEELRDTHERFFNIVRRAHPTLPIICLTQPYPHSEDHEARKELIKQNYLKARAAGDENVYFVDMIGYLNGYGILDESTVDRIHPNDLGFFYMAKAVEEVLKDIL